MKRLWVSLAVLAALSLLTSLGCLLGAIWTDGPVSSELGATSGVAFIVGLCLIFGAVTAADEADL